MNTASVVQQSTGDEKQEEVQRTQVKMEVNKMMYSEFVAGTGCRETNHNYQVYKELEIIYMNTDCTKEHIYEMGKKLVDNSKTEAELKFEAEIKAEIELHNNEIIRYKGYISDDEFYLNYWKEQGDKDMIKMYRNRINFSKDEIKIHRNKIRELKWVLQ